MTLKQILAGTAAALSLIAAAPALAVGVPLAAVVEAPRAGGDDAVRAPRLVPLEGVKNFRDIGGYRTADGRRVKWGVIYRSAELSDLTPADLIAVGRLGVGTIHDLRTVEERARDVTAWTGEGAPAIVAHDYSMDYSAFAGLLQGELTVEGARAIFAASYPQMLKMQRPQQKALFESLLSAEGGTLYHCTAGKDRTGMATALILAALGVPRETIIADYEMSNRYYGDLVMAANDNPAADDPEMAAFARLPADVRAVFMGVDGSYLQAVFDWIDAEYGSVEGYLERELDVDGDDIARLKALYLS